MGDYWEHEVRIEQFLDWNPKKTYPVCTGGSGACPPEGCDVTADYLESTKKWGRDCGSVWVREI